MELVTSAANPLVKRARSLTERKHRRREGAFLVEGQQPVWRAVESGWPIEAVLHAPGLLTSPDARSMVADLRRRGVRVVDVSDEVFARLTDREGPTGLAAIVAIPPVRALADVPLPADAVVVVLERVANPGNLGTILRTADAVGATAAVLVGETADPWAPGAVKASMGSVFAVPVVAATPAELAAWATAEAVRLVASSGYAREAHWDADWSGRVALMLGNEGAGLSTELAGLADGAVRIPMRGTAESLNLATAAAVLLYEARRHRL